MYICMITRICELYFFLSQKNWRAHHRRWVITGIFWQKFSQTVFILCRYQIDGFDHDCGCCCYLIWSIHLVSLLNPGLRGFDHQPVFKKKKIKNSNKQMNSLPFKQQKEMPHNSTWYTSIYVWEESKETIPKQRFILNNENATSHTHIGLNLATNFYLIPKIKDKMRGFQIS